MTKDYAKKRRPTVGNSRKSHSQSYSGQRQSHTLLPPWAWMTAGLILGLSLSAIAFLKLIPVKSEPAKVATEEKTPGKTLQALAKNSAKQLAAVAESKNLSRFDFYTLLPATNMEVPEVLESATSAIDTKAPLPKTTLASKPQTYIIQAGSFREKAQAEELKAQLALTGFEARIQTFKVSSDETWFRVYIGPFNNKDQANTQQQALEQAQQLHSVVLKINV